MKNETKEYMEIVATCVSRNSKMKYHCIEAFVLANGKGYEVGTFPKGVQRGKMQKCFMNATLLAIKKGWTYVEGYAISIIPTLHAWCVNGEGKVIDPTWDDGKFYFGVEFSRKYLYKIILERKSYGLLDNMEMDFPLLTGKHQYP